MAMPTSAQLGAALSPAHLQAAADVTSISDYEGIFNEEPQLPEHIWDALQAEEEMAGTGIHGTPAYNSICGMHSYTGATTKTDLYQPTYPSPPTASHNIRPQTPFEMNAGTYAGQASHPQMPYVPPQQPIPTLQAHQGFFPPGQSPMVAPGSEPNNVEPFIGQPPSKRPRIQSPATAQASYQDPNEPDTNSNGWTEAQDDLVCHLMDQKKKMKEISIELKKKFKVSRSPNAISKRLKIIKKRSNRVGSRDAIQNVMSSSLQFLNERLSQVDPGLSGALATQDHHRDPQLNGIRHEAARDLEKGFETLLEGYIFKMQRAQAQVQVQTQTGAQGQEQGQAQAQVQVQAQAGAQGQVEMLVGRHGDADL